MSASKNQSKFQNTAFLWAKITTLNDFYMLITKRYFKLGTSVAIAGPVCTAGSYFPAYHN